MDGFWEYDELVDEMKKIDLNSSVVLEKHWSEKTTGGRDIPYLQLSDS